MPAFFVFRFVNPLKCKLFYTYSAVIQGEHQTELLPGAGVKLTLSV